MPSVYSYRHVELDNVGRGKRVIKPPGGETADIFGARDATSYSSASSQIGDNDMQSVSGHSNGQSSQQGDLSDGLVRQQHQLLQSGQVSPVSSAGSSAVAGNCQPLLLADDFKPNQQPQHQLTSIQQQKLLQAQQEQACRTPKKTIPTIRRNPITGEIYDAPAGGQQMPVRVRQPPGGKSSGIF